MINEHVLAGVQIKVHKGRKIGWFDFLKKGVSRGLTLNVETLLCDRIVEDNIVDGHVLTRFTKAEKSAGLILKKAF